jgi:DNA-binding XRE family transcriptional regulator
MNEKNIPNFNIAEVGNRIKIVRGTIQQTDFATLFLLKQQDISKIERGKIKPPLELLFKISIHFGISLEWLITGQGKMHQANIGIAEIESIYGISRNDSISTGDLVTKTIDILKSNSVYSTALKSNIEAFHHAMNYEEENNKKTAELEKAVRELKKGLCAEPSDMNEENTGKRKAM